MVKLCCKNAFDGDPDGGVLLARLKAEFSRGSNITIEASKLRQWAVDENYSLGTRSLAAQLYARAGGPLVLSNTVPFALLCGTILECDHSRLRQLCEWVCGETFVGEVYLCRCIVTALQRLIKKKVPDHVPLQCLSKCLNVLFQNLLWRCVTAYEVRAIESLLPLQRLCGDTASKQFELFSFFPATIKQKYAFLSFVIPALSVYELQNFEPMLCDQLWVSQRTQPSASATADCALAWALNSLKLSNSLFTSFLIDCLSSFRKVRRLSCCRIWISRFATHNELLPLLKSLKDELANRIESHKELPLCPAELRELTCIDYEWRWEEDEEVWCRNDCFTYAWLSIFSVLCRRGWERTRTEQHCKQIVEEDEEILGCCLMNSQPTVRLEAFCACARLLSHGFDDPENSVSILFACEPIGEEQSVRRLSCCRIWISRFATHNELLPLLKSLKDELANRIESHKELPLCPAELRELTCIDYEWRWEEDEEVWCRNDCFTYAWLSIFSVLCRRGWERTRTEQHCKQIVEEDEEILGCCLMNSQPTVRLEAFCACARLLSHGFDDPENSDFRKRILKSVNRFVIDNLNTDDPCLRREIFRLLRPHWMSSSLLEAIWSGIDERMNSQRIFTSLSIMKIGGFWPNNAIAHIFPFVLHEDAEIRQKAIEILWEKHLDNELINKLEEHLFASFYDQRKIERIGDFCRLLSKYCPVGTMLKRVLAENNFHIPGVLKCVQALLDLEHELCKQYSYLIDRCVEYNEKMMCLSGSTKPGMCSSLVELSSRLDRRSAKHLLFIDAEYTQNLNEYYYTLCVSDIAF
ncbi:hypothetical protein Tcan_18074 [Toxocara canis]|uniref:DUF2428 domain-containing protein n=1 Tax=Toxocara canis TaxID=6265 RepID=A0A0B2V1S2_TOXCA|nr:hypothetical protein Tcan_18074 [Toxocara canis]